MTSKAINIVFAKARVSPNLIFVEIEDDNGASINIGEWSERANGFHVLRIVMEAGDVTSNKETEGELPPVNLQADIAPVTLEDVFNYLKDNLNGHPS